MTTAGASDYLTDLSPLRSLVISDGDMFLRSKGTRQCTVRVCVLQESFLSFTDWFPWQRQSDSSEGPERSVHVMTMNQRGEVEEKAKAQTRITDFNV